MNIFFNGDLNVGSNIYFYDDLKLTTNWTSDEIDYYLRASNSTFGKYV